MHKHGLNDLMFSLQKPVLDFMTLGHAVRVTVNTTAAIRSAWA